MDMKLFSLPFMLTLFIGIITSTNIGLAAPRYDISEKVGDMDFKYIPGQGVKLSISGIPVLSQSSMWVMAPGWISRIYGMNDQPKLIQEATIEPYQGGKKIVLHHYLSPDRNCPFSGTETFILLPDNTYTTSIEFTLAQDTPAIIEWNVGGFNPFLIIGKTFSAITGEANIPIHGTVPVEAVGGKIAESTIARGFRSIILDSRLGPIEISSDPNSNPIFFDYRKNQWADENKPVFWLGLLERDIPFNKKMVYTFSLKFPKQKKFESTMAKTSMSRLPIKKVLDAQIPNWEQNYIMPIPKQLKYTGKLFPLSNQTKIYIGKNPTPGVENALAFFLKDLKDLYQIEPRIIKDEYAENAVERPSIYIGEAPRCINPSTICTRAHLPVPENKEGYSLLVDNNLVSVAANSEPGIFYGLTSLIQLAKVTEEGIYLKGAEIIDYPALSFRGIHCLSGKDAGDEIAKAVRTLMARYKINSLLWQVEYLRWDSHPEIASAQYGITKTDAQKVIDAAKQNNIEIIPMVPSLGHTEWIFANNQHLDLAEDPDKPYAYCVTNPDTYKFIYSIFEEAIAFFKPRYFHIGHDEITTDARFPNRSLKYGKTATDLIMEDTNRLHDWFTERGIKVMLWGDMFLNRDESPSSAFAPTVAEAKKRRALLPKDITICDWHYDATDTPDAFPSLKLWKDEGYDAIGSGWYFANNIRNLAKACVINGNKGYLQTTWAGFNFKIDGNEPSWFQYWAYLWAANYAWTGDNVDAAKLPFSAKQVFLDVWSQRKPVLKKKSGFMIDLQQLYNRRLSDDTQKIGWMGYGADLDLTSFPKLQNLFGETQFLINSNAQDESAIFLAGKFNPKGSYPQQINIPVANSIATELHFLLTAAFRTSDNTEAGAINITYTDGTKKSVKLIYGRNLFAFNDVRTGLGCRLVWQGTAKLGQPVGMWDVIWQNPEPKKKIKLISIRSTGTEASPILLAITGIN
ncbi:MAG: glycoside hydrolase family 20 zincin-like fold domain-containing protein [bacterium]